MQVHDMFRIIQRIRLHPHLIFDLKYCSPQKYHWIYIGLNFQENVVVVKPAIEVPNLFLDVFTHVASDDISLE